MKKFEAREFEHRQGDEYLLLPSPIPGAAPFGHYRDGEFVGFGIGEVDEGQPSSPGSHYMNLSPPQPNGRRTVEHCVRTNAPGSVCHSGVNSREFRSGWERTFGRSGKAN